MGTRYTLGTQWFHSACRYHIYCSTVAQSPNLIRGRGTRARFTPHLHQKGNSKWVWVCSKEISSLLVFKQSGDPLDPSFLSSMELGCVAHFSRKKQTKVLPNHRH